MGNEKKHDLTVHFVKTTGERCTLVLVGQLDLETVHKLTSAFDKALEDDIIHVAIDTKDVDYISSLGFGTFIEAMDRVESRGGTLKFINVGFTAQKIFKLLGIILDSRD